MADRAADLAHIEATRLTLCRTPRDQHGFAFEEMRLLLPPREEAGHLSSMWYSDGSDLSEWPVHAVMTNVMRSFWSSLPHLMI